MRLERETGYTRQRLRWRWIAYAFAINEKRRMPSDARMKGPSCLLRRGRGRGGRVKGASREKTEVEEQA